MRRIGYTGAWGTPVRILRTTISCSPRRRASTKVATDPGVAVYKFHQRRGLLVTQFRPAGRFIEPGQPRLDRHWPALGVAVAAVLLTIGAATIRATPNEVTS